MPYFPTVPIAPMTTQRTATFRGVRRHDRIREGEWARAENLTSACAPMLSVRAPRSHVSDCGGTVLALAPGDPPAMLYRAENDPDTVILQYALGTERFACPADTDPGGLLLMGALLVLPGLGFTVNTATGERCAMRAVFTPENVDITDGLRNPYVLKLCPCDAEGNELRVFELTTAANGQVYEADPAAYDVLEGECYAVGSERLLRRYCPGKGEAWQTMPHFLRVEAAGIGEAGFRVGDWIDVRGLPTEWSEGVFVEDTPWDMPDPLMGHNHAGTYDDDPNGLREIAAVGEGFLVLRDVFYTRRVTAAYSAVADARLAREMPEMDFVVEARNRLWGCRCGTADGESVNEIYASALGDPTAWQRFNGLSTASWTASVGSEGAFTGAGVLDGCPVFFKADRVHRVYPSALGAHRITEQRLTGVAPGCHRSIVPFEGGLSFVSHAGVVRWSGGSAFVLSDALGTLRPTAAAAGAWGRRLFLSLTEGDQETLWVYDAEHETWFSESALPGGLPRCYLARGEHLYAAAGGAVWDLLGRAGTPEGPVHYACTSGLIGYAVTEQKLVSRFVLRLMLPVGSRMDVWLEYDSDGVWRHAGHLRGQGTGSFLLPVRPRRCDHFRIRLTGEGDMRLYSIVKHLSKGSDKP